MLQLHYIAVNRNVTFNHVFVSLVRRANPFRECVFVRVS